MDDALLMRGLERLGDLPRDGEGSARGSGPRAMCAERSSPSTNSITRAREPGPADPLTAGPSSIP